MKAIDNNLSLSLLTVLFLVACQIVMSNTPRDTKGVPSSQLSTYLLGTFPDTSRINWLSLEPGLEYHVLEEGKGKRFTAASLVTVDYTGWLSSGTQFNDSRSRKQPVRFKLGINQVNKGWDKALLAMQPGARWLLKMSPAWGYGEKGNSRVPPNSILLFDLSLISGEQSQFNTDDFPDVKKITWKKTASGLEYFDLKAGTGKSPQTEKNVIVHYTGWLLDGKKFDSSRDRGQTFSFALGQGEVIKGWDEGIASMKKGGKRLLKIPPSLAYGISGSGSIPANATLIFSVELVP